MSFSTTIAQPVKAAEAPSGYAGTDVASLMGMLMLTVYAANKSRKQYRRLKRRYLWTAFKLKAKSFFTKRAVSNRTLIYILLAVILVAVLLINPYLALIVALVALILLLLGAL